MADNSEHEKRPGEEHLQQPGPGREAEHREQPVSQPPRPGEAQGAQPSMESGTVSTPSGEAAPEGRPVERRRPGARGTAAMDAQTRREVARKGGQAVSRNRQHMSEIGRKGGQSVSKNREHMAKIGRKGGAASRGHHQ